jgi:hypothetical protein
VKPRIPLATDEQVDPVTTELVRIRNARHQTCFF